MNYLHYDLGYKSKGDLVQVTLKGSAANVCLMDTPNFQNYRRGSGYRYVGGHYTMSPVSLVVPSAGHWHITVDLGGYGGNVQASVRA